MRITKELLKEKLLRWVWKFPQSFVALCLEGVICSYSIQKGIDSRIFIINTLLPSSISLGDFIFIRPHSSEKSIKHELGHSKQSDILGPLYLIIIGIPSLLHNIIHSICSRAGFKWDYYSFYTEKWADRLVGIDRGIS